MDVVYLMLKPSAAKISKTSKMMIVDLTFVTMSEEKVLMFCHGEGGIRHPAATKHPHKIFTTS